MSVTTPGIARFGLGFSLARERRSRPTTPSRKLHLLGRRWPWMVMCIYCLGFAIATPLALISLNFSQGLTQDSTAMWLMAHLAGAVATFLACLGADETDRVTKHVIKHNSFYNRTDEVGTRARLARLRSAIKFFEINGLVEPSTAIFTGRQCELFRESFEEMLDQVAASEEDLESPELPAYAISPA